MAGPFSIGVAYRGLDGLQRAAAAGGNRDIRNGMRRQLRESAKLVRTAAKRLAPVGTITRTATAGSSKSRQPGRLRRKIRSTVRVKSATDAFAIIGPKGSDVFYGRFVEFGTSRTEAQPFMAPAAAATRSRVEENMARPLSDFARKIERSPAGRTLRFRLAG